PSLLSRAGRTPHVGPGGAARGRAAEPRALARHAPFTVRAAQAAMDPCADPQSRRRSVPRGGEAIDPSNDRVGAPGARIYSAGTGIAGPRDCLLAMKPTPWPSAN